MLMHDRQQVGQFLGRGTQEDFDVFSSAGYCDNNLEEYDVDNGLNDCENDDLLAQDHR